jgi:hypothetical protein
MNKTTPLLEVKINSLFIRQRWVMVSILGGMLFLSPPSALAAETPEKGTLSLVLENDLFYNADNHYTNGVRAAWLSAPGRTQDWALRMAGWFPLFPVNRIVRTSYAVGQNMYTPEDIDLRDPPLEDRPYGG